MTVGENNESDDEGDILVPLDLMVMILSETLGFHGSTPTMGLCLLQLLLWMTPTTLNFFDNKTLLADYDYCDV